MNSIIFPLNWKLKLKKFSFIYFSFNLKILNNKIFDKIYLREKTETLRELISKKSFDPAKFMLKLKNWSYIVQRDSVFFRDRSKILRALQQIHVALLTSNSQELAFIVGADRC